jgi:ssRNA-specific RNase YbeY (16S rRNA maturation enzyme)
MRFVDRIEPDGTEEAVCIRVAAADSLYVTAGHLLTHNTLNDAFIVLDEAQNTTAEQMKMFLTRIGFNSKAVVTGDVSQVDLPSGRRSGLRIVGEILEGIEGVAFSRLEAGDVVRHHIVQRIVEAYAAWDLEQEERPRAARGPGRGHARRSEVAIFLADEQDVAVDADDLLALAAHVVEQRRVPPDMELSLLLVDRDTIAGLNQAHLGKEGPTDVLAFPIDEPGESPPDTPAILGDVVLCPAVAHEQAPTFGRTPTRSSGC